MILEPLLSYCLRTSSLGETDVRPDTSGQGDFLERERALLGEDADLFNAGDSKPGAATVEDGDDDLLGGDDFVSAPAQTSGGDIDDFESSFPAIDTTNNVRMSLFSLHLYFEAKREDIRSIN